MLLGIDYGDKRIGLALAEDRGPALPWKIIDNDQRVIDQLIGIVTEQNITAIVIGWPLNMQGQVTERTKITDNFVKQVQAAIDREIILEDERWSSKIVDRAGISGPIDDKSAAHILQSYIDRQNSNV